MNIQIISKLCPYSCAEDPTLIFRGVSIHLRKLWDRCRCWLPMLSRPTGRRRRTNRRQFFISLYKRNGKTQAFHPTLFHMVFYGFPINISIVGFWGGFADACSKEPERWERIYQKQQQLLAQAKYRWGAERLEFEPLNTTGLMRFHGILIGFYRDLMINLVESITHMENS